MIKRIFFDLDECLLHTSVGREPEQECFSFVLDDYPQKYYTIFRPEALPILAHARRLVGHDNVYVLTTSVRDYAHILTDAGGFGFEKDHIFTREDLDAHRWPTAYGGRAACACEKIADENNVMIDNLPPYENERKSIFIGIREPDRYIHVRDYYGVNFPNDPFMPTVIDKLNEINSRP
jgi:hypothetical protein